MSVRSFSRRWAPLLLLGALAVLTCVGLLGCGGEKEVDPYVYASLPAVMDGDTTSQNFLFEIDAPQFDFVRGNTAIIRVGHRLEFMVGTALEDNYRSYAGTLLGVQKFFKPSPYLMIKRVKRAGVATPVDSCTHYVVPKLLPASAVDQETPGGPLPDLKYNDRKEIERFLPNEEEGGKLVQVQTAFNSIVHRPRIDLPDSAQMNPSEADMAWYAVGKEVSYEIVDLTPGAEFMLECLGDKDMMLAGCVSLTEYIDSLKERRQTYEGLGHVIGKIKLIWFRYANAYVQGSKEM